MFAAAVALSTESVLACALSFALAALSSSLRLVPCNEESTATSDIDRVRRHLFQAATRLPRGDLHHRLAAFRPFHLRHLVEHLWACVVQRDLELEVPLLPVLAIEVLHPMEALLRLVPGASSAATVVTASAPFLSGGDRGSPGGGHNLEQLSKSLGIDNHVLIDNHQLRHHVRHSNTQILQFSNALKKFMTSFAKYVRSNFGEDITDF